MVEYEFSEHAHDMLEERRILESWVELAVQEPERTETREDGTVHHIRAIEECGGRYLRVVVNPSAQPWRVVTVFFDRRLRRRP